MNCFSHAISHLHDPYFAVGCCLPDWLSACDRKCRAREKFAIKFIDHQDSIIATTARGVVQHHRDDDWFHRSPIFNKLILDFAVELRAVFGNERSMRPSLVGHIAVELFLDAYLHAEYPGRLEEYYSLVDSVDAVQIQSAINLFATRPTDKLVEEIARFRKARYLFDYATDSGVAYRINRVLQRVKLDQLDDRFVDWMPNARDRVNENAKELLSQIPLFN